MSTRSDKRIALLTPRYARRSTIISHYDGGVPVSVIGRSCRTRRVYARSVVDRRKNENPLPLTKFVV